MGKIKTKNSKFDNFYPLLPSEGGQHMIILTDLKSK
jgi:hypothetical protein